MRKLLVLAALVVAACGNGIPASKDPLNDGGQGGEPCETGGHGGEGGTGGEGGGKECTYDESTWEGRPCENPGIECTYRTEECCHPDHRSSPDEPACPGYPNPDWICVPDDTNPDEGKPNTCQRVTQI